MAVNPNLDHPQPINNNQESDKTNLAFKTAQISALGEVQSNEIFDEGRAVAVAMTNKDFFIYYLHYKQRNGKGAYSALVNPRIPRHVLLQEPLAQFLFSTQSGSLAKQALVNSVSKGRFLVLVN